MSFLKTHNLLLTITQEKKNKSPLNKQLCFVHILTKCYSPDTVYDVQAIVQEKLLFPHKAGLEPST